MRGNDSHNWLQCWDTRHRRIYYHEYLTGEQSLTCPGGIKPHLQEYADGGSEVTWGPGGSPPPTMGNSRVKPTTWGDPN